MNDIINYNYSSKVNVKIDVIYEGDPNEHLKIAK